MDFTPLCRVVSGCLEWWELWPVVSVIGLLAASVGLALERWKR